MRVERCGPFGFCVQGLSDVYELISHVTFFDILKRFERLVQDEFDHKVLFGTPARFSVSFPLSKGPSRRFEASGEGVGFDPSSHVLACLSRVDIPPVEKRCGCRFSHTSIGCF